MSTLSSVRQKSAHVLPLADKPAGSRASPDAAFASLLQKPAKPQGLPKGASVHSQQSGPRQIESHGGLPARATHQRAQHFATPARDPADGRSSEQLPAESSDIANAAPRDRTFGFGALGMFGLHSGGAPAARTDNEAAAAPADELSRQDGEAALTRAAANSRASTQAGSIASGTRDAFPASDVATSHPEWNVAAGSAEPVFAVGQNTSGTDLTVDMDDATEAAGQQEPMQSAETLPRPDAPVATLMASGESDQLILSARMQGVVAADVVQTLLDTAAEFDATIGEIRINGVTPTQFIPGGSRGSRTR